MLKKFVETVAQINPNEYSSGTSAPMVYLAGLVAQAKQTLAQSRAQEIVDVVVNDAHLSNDAAQTAEMPTHAVFALYSRIVRCVAARYSARGWTPFTLEDMAQAIVLLHERFSGEE